MSKNKKKPIEPWLCINPQDKTFIRPSSDFMKCRPFVEMNFSSQILYLRMAEAAAGHIEFKYPRSYYKGIMYPATFEDARDELVKCGFIEIVQNNKNLRKANLYRFSDRWRQEL